MYNSALSLSFTSIGAKIDPQITTTRPQVVFIPFGFIHRIGTLLPEPGSQPQFAPARSFQDQKKYY
jgi:hypothetical protein